MVVDEEEDRQLQLPPGLTTGTVGPAPPGLTLAGVGGHAAAVDTFLFTVGWRQEEGGGERWMEGWLVGGFGWRVGEKTRDREIRFHPLQTDSARLLTL